MAIENWLLGLAGAALAFALVIAIALYVYVSWALMAIAKKTKTEPAWLAWIPIANLFLIARIAETPWWTALLVIFLPLIPVVGAIAAAAIGVYWWWQISEKRGYDGWFGVLFLIPIVNLVILGVLAFSDK